MPVVVDAHPFELGLGLVGIVNGVRTIVTTQTTPAVSALPDAPIVALTAAGLLGGLFMLGGLLGRSRALGRSIERYGLWLAGGSYLGYCAVLWLNIPIAMSWSSITLSGILGIACLIRQHAVGKAERVILKALRTANEDHDVVALLLFDGRAGLRPDGEA